MLRMRSYQDADLDAVKDLVDGTIDSCYADIYPPAAIAFFKEYHSLDCIAADAQAGCTVVIEEDGRLVGTGTLLGANVRRMFVEPAHRGRGLGHMLLSRLELQASVQGLTVLDLSASLPAHHFYLRHGYKTLSYVNTPLSGGEALCYYAMAKELAAAPPSPRRADT